jgi:hypothetical protein
LFRETEAAAIGAKKHELKTQLDVVGALAVLENKLNVGQDPIENSRLVLGMVLGNGYKDGVTTRLVASPQEKAVIERVVKKAAAHVRASFNVDAVDVSGAPAKAMEHVGTLNRWITGVVKKEPQFVYQAKRAEPYKTLDQAITDIGRAFAAIPMIQHAIRLIPDPLGFALAPILRQFIVCFAKLTPAEQAEIVRNYNAGDGDDDSLLHIAIGCNNIQAARQYIQQKIHLREEARRAEAARLAEIARREEEARRAEAARLAAERAGREAQAALDNYRRILDGAIARVVGRADYTAMLNELKTIGVQCFTNQVLDQKEQSDWIRTLILTFADVNDAAKNTLYTELGNFIRINHYGANANGFAAGRISDENKLMIAINMYFFLVEELAAGRIVIPPPPVAVQAPVPPPAIIQPPIGGAPPIVIPQGPWNFWAGPGRLGKDFVMPAGLNADEQEYVSFFMTRVMPKLVELRTANHITDNLVECVIRAASMGLVGMTEYPIYIEEFEKNLDEALRRPRHDGTLNVPGNGLIGPDQVADDIRAKRRFPLINDRNPFFRNIGPTYNPIKTFNSLHTEDEARAFVEEYNAVPAHQRAAKVVELKNKQKAKVESKLLGLPGAIRQTFQFLLDQNCAVPIWVRFIKGFDTSACYDGTYDRIAPIGTEITTSGDGTDQRPPNKIFAKMLNEIPANLADVITDAAKQAIVDRVKIDLGSPTPNPPADYFLHENLDPWFGVVGSRKIKDFVGNGPDGQCKLTDPQMLELIYWSHVMTDEFRLPPVKALEELFTTD